MKTVLLVALLGAGCSETDGTSSTTTETGTMSSTTETAVTTTSGTTETATIDTSVEGQLCINEFMASNQGYMPGPDKSFPDWIEVYNPTDVDISLKGFGLSDRADDPTRHILGDITIAAGGFLLFWADGNEKLGVDHLAFQLDADGEFIGLFRPDGSSIDKIEWDAELTTDWSVVRGPKDCGSELDLDDSPTPGQSNTK
mgnify:CR=1 FL=1